jgi:hypothetical protein
MICGLELILELYGEINAVLHDTTEPECPRAWSEGTHNGRVVGWRLVP